MKELCVIGGGPAGLQAAIYAARGHLSVTLIAKDDGALSRAEQIENYFGFPEPISGAALLERGRKQAERLGVRLIDSEVVGIEYAAMGFTVKTAVGDFAADAVILATGASRATPPLTGVKEFEGRGVSYCAVCDAFFYRGKAVAVLGQGDYAIEEARTLLPAAASVTLLTDGAPAPEVLPEGLAVDTRKLTAVTGEERVTGVTFAEGEPLAADGVFIAYGVAGSTDFARKLGAMIENGRIKVNADFSTNVPGLFAAGDCTGGLLQVAKAVSEGAQAAMGAIHLLRNEG